MSIIRELFSFVFLYYVQVLFECWDYFICSLNIVVLFLLFLNFILQKICKPFNLLSLEQTIQYILFCINILNQKRNRTLEISMPELWVLSDNCICQHSVKVIFSDFIVKNRSLLYFKRNHWMAMRSPSKYYYTVCKLCCDRFYT